MVDNADPTGLATVARQDLSEQTQVSATLGYAGSYSVVNQAQGTVTALPAVGQIVSQGQVLYRVSGAPVVVLYGTTPAYRSLSEGAYASAVTGTDVAELNADLVALGYATSAEIPAGSDEFTWWTKDAVEKLQAALGVTQTGTLTLGQAVFLPSAVRVTTVSATLGGRGAARPAGAHRHLDHPPGQHRPRRRPAVRGGRRRQGDHHPAQQPDHPWRDLLGRHRRHGRTKAAGPPRSRCW